MNNNYPPAFWEWAARLTRRYLFAHEKIYSDKIGSGIFIDFIFTDENVERLESFIYQAIDGVNKKKYFCIVQNNYSIFVYETDINNKIKKTLKDKRFVFEILPEIEGFFEKEYENSIAASLAALKWIWEQEIKRMRDMTPEES